MFFPEYTHTHVRLVALLYTFLHAAHLPRDLDARRTRRLTLITHINYYNIYHNKVVFIFK